MKNEKPISFIRLVLHAVMWFALFTFWLVIVRQHHPTLTIAIYATAVLVASCAIAVYINGLYLIPAFARTHNWASYCLYLLANVLVLDLLAVLLIQGIYDHMWGPDPMRYGFGFNLATDGFAILLHIAGAMIAVRSVNVFRRHSSRRSSST